MCLCRASGFAQNFLSHLSDWKKEKLVNTCDHGLSCVCLELLVASVGKNCSIQLFRMVFVPCVSSSLIHSFKARNCCGSLYQQHRATCKRFLQRFQKAGQRSSQMFVSVGDFTDFSLITRSLIRDTVELTLTLTVAISVTCLHFVLCWFFVSFFLFC